MRLLVAEDDARLLKSLLHVFKSNRFLADGVDNGADALDYALSGEYDAIVMDVMMPAKDGLAVLRELRENKVNTPVLLLTARTQIEQRIEGLDAGADDYLPKPFAMAELLARVRAIIRRKDNYTPDRLSFGQGVLDGAGQTLCGPQQKAALSAREFQIMEMLMRNQNVIITPEQLITHIWGWESDVDVSVVWVHVSNLRKKIEKAGAGLQIRFVRNAGYVLEESYDR